MLKLISNDVSWISDLVLGVEAGIICVESRGGALLHRLPEMYTPPFKSVEAEFPHFKFRNLKAIRGPPHSTTLDGNMGPKMLAGF